MNTMQSALRSAFGDDLDVILRKARFDRAVERGEQLLQEATRATKQGHLAAALKAVRKDRYACAAYIARHLSQKHRKFVPVEGDKLSGFSELTLMEELWAKEATVAAAKNGSS